MSSGSSLFLKQNTAAKPHLLKHGTGGEVAELRRDLVETFAPLAALTVEEFLKPPGAVLDAIRAASPALTTPQTLRTRAAAGRLPFPRNLTVTVAGATPGDAPPDVTFVGRDVDGHVQREKLALPAAAGTVSGMRIFAVVTTIEIAAARGPGATLAFGTGLLLGLTKRPRARAGLAAIWREIVDGAAVSPPTGAFTPAATHPPHGAYVPATAPDGTHDYAIFLEYDPRV
jgi:hypothetical protein